MNNPHTVSGSLDELMALIARQIDADDLAAAENICAQLQSQLPNVADLWFYRAAIASKRAQFRAALAHLDTANGFGVPKPKYHELRLKICHTLGRLAEAEAYYWQHRRAITDPESLAVIDRVRAALGARATMERRRAKDGRFDLADVTFLIPVYIETADRARNLDIVLRFLAKHFATRVVVAEDVKDGASRAPEVVDGLSYQRVPVIENDSPYFHKTWMVNHALAQSATEINIVHDSDVVAEPVQYALARQQIQTGADVVFAYSGTVVDMPESQVHAFAATLDVATLDPLAEGSTVPGLSAHGGALFVTRRVMDESGGFNENIVAWGLEDREMVERFVKLGRRVERVEGALFHLRHQRTVNSNETHPFWNANLKHLESMRAMTREELANAVRAGRFRRPLVSRRDLP